MKCSVDVQDSKCKFSDNEMTMTDDYYMVRKILDLK